MTTNLETMCPEKFGDLQKSYPGKVLIELEDEASNFYQIVADKATYVIDMIDRDMVQQIKRIAFSDL